MPQAESFLSVSQKKQKQDCMLTGDFNMISKLSFKKISTLLGWCSFALLLVFIANIAIGKYMHLKKMSIVSPINGVEEFLLFGPSPWQAKHLDLKRGCILWAKNTSGPGFSEWASIIPINKRL